MARGVGVLGGRWTLLILREALEGATRFVEFRKALGLAPDLLGERLGTLVDFGIMIRKPYQEPGRRTRHAYHLTHAGRELGGVVRSLEQWVAVYLPPTGGLDSEASDAGRSGPRMSCDRDDRDSDWPDR
jgi:DNA-binding HxlR family transcriptional regulator